MSDRITIEYKGAKIDCPDKDTAIEILQRLVDKPASTHWEYIPPQTFPWWGVGRPPCGAPSTPVQLGGARTVDGPFNVEFGHEFTNKVHHL